MLERETMSDQNRLVLAYSGGLDTSVAISYLKERTGKDVVAVSLDVGQGGESLETIKQRALACGAVEAYVVDARNEFANEYCMKALKANALYEGVYPLVSAISRPLISKHLVRAAHQFGADTISHGCTGKGNDQVRFETAIKALDPKLEILAPVRDWELHPREEEIDWAAEHGVPVKASKASPYSIDDNVWGRAIECGALENPWNEPPADIWTLSVDPENAPNEAEYVEIGFEKGVPCSLNGEEKSFLQIVMDLNVLAGKHGCGRIDMVENRLVGVKSRECYETPAAEVLIAAHKALETLCLDRETQHFKLNLEHQWSTTVYYGQWFSPLKNALDAFFAETQKFVTGTVKVKLYKGSCTVAGRMSDHSLYDYGLASYTAADTFDHKAAKGFIDLSALPFAVWAEKQGHEAQDL